MSKTPAVRPLLVPGTGKHAKTGANLFDLRPAEVGGFRLTGHTARAVGKPSLDDWQTAFTFASSAVEASSYWVGDLLLYAEGRADWLERMSQAQSVTGLAEKTLHNLTYIAKHVEEPERQVAPSISHAAEVAALPRPEQTKWLTKASREGWTSRETRHAIKHHARSRVIEGQADTMHTVEVSVELAVEASSTWNAEQMAWEAVKAALREPLPKAKVIGSKARPK